VEIKVVDKIMLGKTGIQISPLGLGLMQWGDIKLEKSSSGHKSTVSKMFSTALENGINFFDTAEMYGRGRSEMQLRQCLEEFSPEIVIATKFMPFPWRLSKGDFRKALKRSLNRLGVEHIDLYQMHWPFPPVPIPTWMDAMADAVDDGLVRAVGVSNYSPRQVQIAYESLSRHKIPLASNQVRYSLLERQPETSGLLELCNQLGVKIIAYSPLEKGILTGKYTSNNPVPGLLAWRYNKAFLKKLEALFTAMHEIGDNHNEKTLAMVALNWLIDKGAVPIPGAHSFDHAVENFGALGWQMNHDEVDRLNELSMQLFRAR
jgi:aryl-alcohol dehydrogenase-like predicted oxidoreductase